MYDYYLNFQGVVLMKLNKNSIVFMLTIAGCFSCYGMWKQQQKFTKNQLLFGYAVLESIRTEKCNWVINENEINKEKDRSEDIFIEREKEEQIIGYVWKEESQIGKLLLRQYENFLAGKINEQERYIYTLEKLMSTLMEYIKLNEAKKILNKHGEQQLFIEYAALLYGCTKNCESVRDKFDEIMKSYFCLQEILKINKNILDELNERKNILNQFTNIIL